MFARRKTQITESNCSWRDLFGLDVLCWFFFRNSWCSQVQWYSVMFSRENETASFLIICFCLSVSYFIPFFFFLLFSLFFLLSFFFINYDKVFFFSFHLLLFSFFLVFRTRHGVVNKDLVRDEALRFCLTPPPPPKKCCLTEDDQLGFLGNCQPTPPLSHR